MKLGDYLAEELPFRAWLDAYLDPAEIKTIFEVGACEAEDSIKLSRAFSNASVYAFEPLPKNIELSKKHIKEYKAERIELFPLALSNKTGEATFFVSSGQPASATKDPDWDYGNKSSSLLPPEQTIKVHEWLKFNEKIIVKSERLDNFCKQNDITEIDFLYMDVQGAELMVLEGAGKLLNKINAVWLEVEAVELYKDQPLRTEVEKFMKKAGFTCVMDTVDSVSGDQLYINDLLIAKVKKIKEELPEHRLKTLEGLYSYTEAVWLKQNHTVPQKILLENRIEELFLEINELSDKLNAGPTLSVVMSVYNGGKFLQSAIESILNQSFKDFEFIIVDDGSKDDSANIVRKINDPRIRLIQQSNHGLNYSLNKGIRLARAPLIARMDQDDISLPSRFEKQVTILAETPEIGMVSTFFTHIDEVTEKKGVTMAFPFKPIDVKRCFYQVNSIAHGSAMFRKSVWKDVGGFDPKYQPPDDFQLWTKIANVADIVIIPESLYLYRVSSTGMTATMSGLAEMAEIITNEYWLQGYKSKGLFAILRDAKFYRNLDSRYAQQIYEQYKAQQLHIVKGLLPRQHIGAAIKMILAVILLDKNFERKHFRLVLSLGKATAKVILRRPKIIGNTLK